MVEVVDDFYVRKFAATAAGTPAFDRVEALRLARRAVGDPQARLEPAGATRRRGGRADAFATAVRGEVERRKRARGLHDLRRPGHPPARRAGRPRPRRRRARLRSRYRVVLVDEFQDTDPVQWGILRHFAGHVHAGADRRPEAGDLRLPGRGRRHLPRRPSGRPTPTPRSPATGAATPGCCARWTRCSAAPRWATRGSSCGEVESAHPVPRLAGAPVDAPLRLRVLARDGLACSGRGLVLTPEARDARSPATSPADVAALLASGATVDGAPAAARRRRGAGAHERPGHGRSATRSPPSACPPWSSGTASVFATPAAPGVADAAAGAGAAAADPGPRRGADLLPRPDRRGAVRGGGDDAADALLDELGATLRRWAAVLHGKRGRRAARGGHHRHRPARAAARRRGRRAAAHRPPAHRAGAARRRRRTRTSGPAALVEWLRHRIDEAAADVGLERSRRLDSDAAAVQVITVHRSKGLEFPVVYVPFGWDRYVPREPDVPLLHDDGGRAGARRRRAGRAALVRALRAATRPRRRARTCGCCTSR